MSNLKGELDEYLSRNETPAKNGFANYSINMPKLGKMFNKIESEDNETLLTSGERKYGEICFNFPTMTRMQRLVCFGISLLMCAVFFGLALLHIPVLVLKARKFALLFTLGSCSFLCSFSFLWGPLSFIKHLFGYQRLPFTFLYFGTLVMTLYCSMYLRSTPFTILAAMVQLISLIWFVLTYIPGGGAGISLSRKILSSAVTGAVSRTLPV